jgi:hypothetical protein
MSDQELANQVHNATRALNDAIDAARAAGLRVSVAPFSFGDPLISHVDRFIPAVVTEYRRT